MAILIIKLEKIVIIEYSIKIFLKLYLNAVSKSENLGSFSILYFIINLRLLIFLINSIVANTPKINKI